MKKQYDKKRVVLNLILIAASVALLIYANENMSFYSKRIINLCAVYAIMGLSMNLINGFTGMFSLGSAGFMAIGAYAVAIFTVPVDVRAEVFYLQPMWPLIANIHIGFLPAMILGGFLSAIAAFLIGFPVLRLRGDYLAIATLGFSEIIRIAFTNLQTVTNGPLGIKYIPSFDEIWWPVGVAIVTTVFMFLLIKSTYGRAFKAIREDEIAAEAMGINLFKHKMLSFVISGFMAGMGGALMAGILGTIDPKQFLFTLTYNFLLIIVLGGMGSISGTIISSVIVTAGLEWLRIADEPMIMFGYHIPMFRPGFRMVVFSILLMAIVLFFSKGLMGTKELSWELLGNWYKRQRARFIKKDPSLKGGGSK
ncbi:MAG TPA: branched-chain amino acid ABC transporter permease [Peptococcaceae bacterium]|nr:branched-chain amino acid ABC transporter permease [Peptococcaceae bacterium]